MPRYFLHGTRRQVNLSLDTDAFQLLDTLAPSRRSYGAVLSALIREEVQRTQDDSLVRRVERLEMLLTEK
jgi:hypothetical protein